MTEPITAHADPADEAPWALQVVVRAEKNRPPAHTAVLTAVARTVVDLLHVVDHRPADAPGALTGADAAAAVARWRAGRIRKVVRRARGAAWVGSDLPQAHTRVFDGVEVRALLPAPVDRVPAEIRKLQVTGLDLADPGQAADRPREAAVVYLNPRLALSTGKAAAQVAHAAQLLYETGDPDTVRGWLDRDAPLTVATPTAAEWERVAADAPVSITDAGFTEIPPGTRTCVATHHHHH